MGKIIKRLIDQSRPKTSRMNSKGMPSLHATSLGCLGSIASISMLGYDALGARSAAFGVGGAGAQVSVAYALLIPAPILIANSYKDDPASFVKVLVVRLWLAGWSPWWQSACCRPRSTSRFWLRPAHGIERDYPR
jgi:hypothetical protein